METSIFSSLTRSLSLELPYLETMDEYVDFIVGAVKPLSEDLAEKEYFLDTRWKEFSDANDFTQTVLHFFREGGEYLKVTDGNVNKGKWQLLPKSNSMMLEIGPLNELYDLTFLDANFFILAKNGDQKRLSKRKYLVMGREGHLPNAEWRDVMESLFNEYRQNYRFKFFLAVVFIVIVAVLLISIS